MTHGIINCDVNVIMVAKKPNILHDLLHGVNLTICKSKKHNTSQILFQNNYWNGKIRTDNE